MRISYTIRLGLQEFAAPLNRSSGTRGTHCRMNRISSFKNPRVCGPHGPGLRATSGQCEEVSVLLILPTSFMEAIGQEREVSLGQAYYQLDLSIWILRCGAARSHMLSNIPKIICEESSSNGVATLIRAAGLIVLVTRTCWVVSPKVRATRSLPRLVPRKNLNVSTSRSLEGKRGARKDVLNWNTV